MERKWWALVAVCTATFMLLLDITIVNVAIPSIRSSLHASFADVQWVIDAYALMLAALLLTAGAWADLFGRRIVFAIGLVLFTIASLLCGLAHSPGQLIAARAAQGVGGAVMFATSLAIIAAVFQGKQRATAFGVWGATTGLAVAVGPLVGGALTEWINWRWIFFLNIPIGIFALVVTLRDVPESKNPNASRVDWAGVLTFSVALLLLVYALITGNDHGWGSTRIVSMLAGAALLLVAFVVAEARQQAPMFDLALFRNPSFVGAAAVAFALSASMFAMFLYFTLFLQDHLRFSPLEAGLRFLPVSLLSFVAAAVSGRLTETVPVKVLLSGGMALVAGGLTLMYGVGPSDSWTRLLPGFLLGGVGIGMVNPALASTAIGVVEPWRGGMASGINSTFRQVGIATGIAGLGAVFQHSVSGDIVQRLHGTAAQAHAAQVGRDATHGNIAHAIASSGRNARLVGSAVDRSFVSGFNDILVISAAIAAAGALAALVLVRGRDFHVHGGPPPGAAAGNGHDASAASD